MSPKISEAPRPFQTSWFVVLQAWEVSMAGLFDGKGFERQKAILKATLQLPPCKAWMVDARDPEPEALNSKR